MWNGSYWGARYFAPVYWAKTGMDAIILTGEIQDLDVTLSRTLDLDVTLSRTLDLDTDIY